MKHATAMPAKVRGRGVKTARKPVTPKRQPLVKGQRRTPRATSLLKVIDAAVEAECRTHGVARAYVLACCAAVALNVKLDPALLYRTFRNFELVKGGR